MNSQVSSLEQDFTQDHSEVRNGSHDLP
jgi:hypothetical protein